MIMEPATYAAAYATSADLDAIIAQVRAHVAACRVETLALETHTDNLTDSILGLCALGGAIRVSVTQLPPANTSPAPDMIAAMLTLNRSDLPDQDWRRAKKALPRRKL